MSHGVAARKRFGGVGFALGCGCKDPKAVAVAVAVAASSPRSGTEASTATTATSRRARTHPSGSGSTGTLTVPSASSSSFLWEDAEADGDEVEFKRPSSATTPSFSGLLRELRELEQSVKSSCARKSPGRTHFSPPPPPPPPPAPPLPPRPAHRRADKASSIKEGHGSFSPPSPPPPPPPPPPLRPPQRRVVRSDEKPSIKEEGHGDFSPPRPQPQSLTHQHRRARSIDKVNGHEGGDPRFTPLPPRPLPPPPPLEPLPRAKTEEDDPGAKKKIEDIPKRASTPPKHRKARSCDATGNTNSYRLDGSVAVVKQSEDPLADFRRSMLNMIVENGIVAGDELRELLRRFLALNAPRHHDAILRAFAEIWDEVFAAPETQPREQPTCRQTAAATRQRTPPRRRPQPPPAWRV
ncbi:ras-associated and pleckstrin homology domains-containing protein 1-like [Lolium rigidum]|uniref:ras-associated and pleckstrin homology domains-containing protein 1-like n=1 Tax=Lolium rigidum TaxID=89674 RepID=UPI001F5C616E|nr:ras-associated and pleckstrin homology domains-containing protein 1-like [Lolium rigidum]